MRWLQEKNSSKWLPDGRVQFNVFAEGEGLSLSLDNQKTFIKPTRVSGLVHEFEIIVSGDQEGQNFHLSEWGYLKNPKKSGTLTQTPSKPIEHQGGTNIGLVGYKYGSSMLTEVDQISEGIAIFNFMGEPGIYYPTPYLKSDTPIWGLDDLVALHIPTHSVSTVWGDKTPSKLKLTMIKNGNKVFELYDTKGGYHGNALAVGETPGQHLRGNNHPDDACRWITYGEAEIIIENIGERPIVFEIATTSSGTKFKKTIQPGINYSHHFNFTKLPNNTDSYKLNCNYMGDFKNYL